MLPKQRIMDVNESTVEEEMEEHRGQPAGGARRASKVDSNICDEVGTPS